ncbi:MAG: MFS transporter [Planctomycetes bacterium]|nr:MFS transporter [Planctomycetota bacterium]
MPHPTEDQQAHRLQPGVGLAPPRREVTGLVLLFGAMYFVQGIAEPTAGLIYQPTRSLLKSWGQTASEITTFSAWLALPWALKPLYGLLTDFVPLLGTRRRSYLVITTLATAAGLGCVYLFPPGRGQTAILFWMLLLPTIGVAFSDVVVDAYMVETGQPRGLTGRLQSVQWASMYAATILTGYVGGVLSGAGRQDLAYLICAFATLCSLCLVLLFVREEHRRPQPGQFREAARQLVKAATTPAVVVAAAFLFLWNFNPFNQDVLYIYMTKPLGFSEEFAGETLSLLAVGAVLASLAYGIYCRRIPFGLLIHGSILAGIASTLAYWGLSDRLSARLISVGVGFAYMTGSLVQLDLAARACPPQAAGTTFALLMGVTNLGMSLSTGVGGKLYERWSALWTPGRAFDLLVGVGAAATAACWLLVPMLRRENAATWKNRA